MLAPGRPGGTGTPPAAHLGSHTRLPGHILTKSRRYSTTYTALREERAEYRRGDTGPTDRPAVVSDSNWRYVGSGYTAGAALAAAGVAEDHVMSRQLAWEAIEDEGRGWEL
nr:replication initiator [Streptomyces sp. WAC 04229]